MTLQIRRDTAANWTAANPVLASGQMGYETNTGRVKVGDGSTAWTSLAYRFESGGGGTNLGYVAATRAVTSSTGSSATLTLADTSNPGLGPARSGVSTEYLSGTGVYSTPAGAAGTNLGYTASTRALTSSTGTGVTLPLVTSTDAGLAPGSGGGTTNFLRADLTWAAPAGGGLSDGDKGDITVSGSGTVWTIDAGVVTLSKQADMATSSLVYRKTAGTGVPEINTLATLKTDLGLTGTNSGDQTSIVGITGTIAQFNTAVTDADLAITTAANTFTGIQSIPTINLAVQSIATAGGTTTLTNASSYHTRFTGTLTQTLVLPNATTLGNGQRYKVTNNSTGAVTVQTNGGATLWIVAGANTDLDLALVDNSTAAGTWELDYRVGSSASGKSTQFNNSFTFNGTDGTTFTFPTTSGTLPLNTVFTSGANGLVPASGGGTTNFLRADGSWVAAGGGSAITVQDEGANITTALATLNFVGAGVTVTGGTTAVVTIPGGSGGFDFGTNAAMAGLVVY